MAGADEVGTTRTGTGRQYLTEKEKNRMKQTDICYDVTIEIEGMGFVLYSEGAVKGIEEGENFFDREYAEPAQVAAHIKKGDIVGFNTGSGGIYHIKFRSGYPDADINREYPVAIRLAIDVKGGKISIIDLFWLMEWSSDCPSEQQIEVEDGIYHLTVLTRKPKSGVWGDRQEIYIYLNRIEEMPKLTWTGVPELFV